MAHYVHEEGELESQREHIAGELELQRDQSTHEVSLVAFPWKSADRERQIELDQL